MEVSQKPGSVFATMNVVPLIDVLLVLLIIFMVITPLTPKGLEAVLPHSPTPDQRPPAEHLVVLQVLGGGELRINQEAVSWEELESRVEAIFRARAEKVAFLRGEFEVEFAEVARAIAVLRTAGVEKVGLLTRLP